MIDFIYKNLIENKSITNNKLSKYIYAIIDIINVYNKHGYYIGDDVFEKSKNLEELYINNRSLTGIEGDETTIEYFEVLKKTIKENKEFKKENKNEQKSSNQTSQQGQIPDKKEKDSVDPKDKNISLNLENKIDDSKTREEYEVIISKLQARLTGLENQLTEYEKVVKTSTKQNVEDHKKIDRLNQKINKIKQELSTLKKNNKKGISEKEKQEKNISKLQDKINKLSAIIEEYKNTIDGLYQTIHSLETTQISLQQEIDDKNSTIDFLNEKIEQSEQMLEKTNNNQEVLDNFIFEQLLIRKMTLDEIMTILINNGFDLNKQDIIDSLKRISSFINVRPTLDFDKTYGIIEPPYYTNQKMFFPNDRKKVDIVFLADYHFDGSNDSCRYLAEKMDSVYNYCTTNNIRCIITLGDLIDDKNLPERINKDSFEMVRDIIKNLDRIMPCDIGIKHFLLGGNHDKAFFRFGIDPIDNLTFEREDAISLGYSNAYIMLGESDVIGLHHEGVPRESSIPDILKSGKQVKDNLKKAYDNAKINISESYFDFFGHFHKSRTDLFNSFGVVPSLNADRSMDGAWHVTLDLDSNGKINYMVINRLSFGKGRILKVADETLYQKIRK